MKITLICLLLTMTSVAMAQTSKGKDYYLLVGTYTNEAKTNGIHVYTFNTGTGDYQEKSITTGITKPSSSAIRKDRKNAYSVNEARRGKGVNAASFDLATGILTCLNSGSAGGQ